MKLAYYISEYPSLSHTFIRREIDELRRRGVVIKVFSTHKCKKSDLLSQSDKDAFDEVWSVNPIRISGLFSAHLTALTRHPLRYLTTLATAFSHRLPGFKNALWSFFYFLESIYVAQEIRRLRLKHIHVHFANSGASVANLAAKYLQISWSMSLHGACDFEYPHGPLLREKAESASFIACASYYGRSQVMRTVSTDHWGKLFVSRCGIELDMMHDTGEYIKRQSDEPIRVLNVGRLSPEKGQLGLIEAFGQAHKVNANLELLLVGEGPDRQILENFVEKKDLSSAVTFLGGVAEEQVFVQMRYCDIFALSSFMEGIPLVLMEAMALRLPVIAPRVAGIPELIEDQKRGLLYNTGHWEQLSEHILTLASNEKMRAEFADEARKWVTENFNITIATTPLYERLKNLPDIE